MTVGVDDEEVEDETSSWSSWFRRYTVGMVVLRYLVTVLATTEAIVLLGISTWVGPRRIDRISAKHDAILAFSGRLGLGVASFEAYVISLACLFSS